MSATLAEIISIGSELTSGQNLDTNSQWLSRRLAEMGIAVTYHTTVADDLAANVEVFRRATRRCGLVLSTGGLGPTLDDLTREALAKAAGVGLESDAAELEHIRAMFAKRGRVMLESNAVQALLPAGAEPLRNDRGTAPGVWVKVGDAWVAAMPGPPSEMCGMFEERVKPRLLRLGLAGGVLLQRKINTFGAGESAVEEKVTDLTRRGHVPEVGITVADGVVSLRILARGATRDEALAQAAPVEKVIRERLGDLVFGVEDEQLQEALAALMGAKRQTLATAESVTAGLVAHRIAQVCGAGGWFKGGVVAYDASVKSEQVGVPAKLVEKYGAVSREVTEALAVAVRTKFGTDLGLSTTGFAGPDADAGRVVGQTFAAVAHAGGVESQEYNWPGTRTEVQSRAAKMALNLARLHLMKASG